MVKLVHDVSPWRHEGGRAGMEIELFCNDESNMDNLLKTSGPLTGAS